MKKPISHSSFLRDVEGFIARHGLSERTLGIEALNDPAFLNRLRHGKSPTLARIEAVYDWMILHEAQADR